MKTIIFFALLVASSNCQQSAFESFMSRNRELFPNLSTGSSQFATSGQQQQQAQPQIQNQWQQPAPVARSNQLPSLPSNEPFVTSNSHIQSFNQPQSFNQQQAFAQPQAFTQSQAFNQPQAFNQLQAPTGQTTTISGPNFQTSINLPAIPSLPQHATQSAPQQQQQQPQFQNQFTSQIHSHQIPSSSAPLVNQPSTGLASSSFFNTQGNNNFPSNFAAPAAPSSLPTPPQTFGPLDFSSFQGNSFFNNQQQRAASPSTPSFAPTNAIRAPGFETFVYMRPSEQPVQGASLRKVIRSPNGVDKELFYVPMPSYSPPSIYTTQVIHGNENKQGQQQ